MKSKVAGTAASTDPNDMMMAIEDAILVFNESREEYPTIIWLHPDWEEMIEEIVDELTLEIKYSNSLDTLEEFELGTDEADVEIEATVSPITEPSTGITQDNMWLAFHAKSAGVKDIIKAADKFKKTFTQRHSIVPTHLALNEVFMNVRQEIEEATGMVVVTDPPVSYKTQGMVGLRTISEVQVDVASSTNVKEIQFFDNEDENNPGVGTLFVTFIREDDSTVMYQYFEVPTAIYEGLVKAASKGAFLNTDIKDKYEYSKIGE